MKRMSHFHRSTVVLSFLTLLHTTLVSLFLDIHLHAQNIFLYREFGIDGWVKTDLGLFGPYSDQLRNTLITADDDIILTGQSSPPGGVASVGIGFYDQVGKLDITKHKGGRIVEQLSLSHNIITSSHLQPDGKIIIGGYIDPELGINEVPFLARFLSDGRLDNSFNSNGRNTFFINGDTQRLIYTDHVSDGKIIGLGYANAVDWPGHLDIFMIRVLENGKQDSTFFEIGEKLIRFSRNSEILRNVIKLKDGKYLLAGALKKPDEKEVFWLGKIKADGNIDASFGTNGSVTYGNPTVLQEISQVIELPDGSILAGGYEFVNGKTVMVLVKYSPSGQLDISFGNDGVWKYSVQNQSQPITGLLYKDDFIYVLSNVGTLLKSNFCLLRLTKSGQIDTTFGNSGIIIWGYENALNRSKQILIHQGQVLITGDIDFDFAMCKILPRLTTEVSQTPGKNQVLKLYPNPIQENTFLEIFSDKEKTIHISLFDMTGRAMSWNQTLLIKTEKQRVPLDFDSIPSGQYILRLTDENNNISDNILIFKN